MSVIGRRLIVLVTASCLSLFATAASAARVVTDPVTGFAIDGFDPVAYFTDHRPRLGRIEHQAMWQEAGWRFTNEGNRQAFLDAPAVYAPRYGGHCAVAVARGFPAEGDPRFWTIHAGRLYLFHSPANREVFMMDPDGFVAAADREWRELSPW